MVGIPEDIDIAKTGAGPAVEVTSVEGKVTPEDEACKLQERQDECDKKVESTASRNQLDEVLIDALRIPRDRIFVLLQEKDMEDKIRSGQEQNWELPLMNSYQRLLVHRIADHFRLSHSIDAITKAVTLTRQVDTEIPEASLSTLAMADMERLSEPAYAISRDSSAAGFKIMRREGAGRSDSPRNGLSDGKSLGKDRRNMTIEEREAAYKEARSRIFGSEEAACVEAVNDSAVSPVGEAETKGLANLSLEVDSSNSRNSSRNTPGQLSPAPSSTSSSSSAAFLRAGAPSFDPSQRSTPLEASHWQSPAYGYPVVDANGNHYFPYPGGFLWPPYLQHDANGRQIVPQGGASVMSPPFYPIGTPGSSGSNHDIYSSVGHSPSVSSRSTSISGGTEGDNGQTSVVRSNNIDQTHNGITTANRGRPHNISPSTSFQQSRNTSSYHPSGSSNGSSSNNGAAGNLMPPHVYQGQIPVPASWNQYPTSPALYNNRPYQQAPMHSVEDSNARNQSNQRMGYAAALTNSSRGNGTVASSGSSVHSSEGASGHLSPVASSSSRRDELDQGSQSRSRNGISERSLFDPHKNNQSGSIHGGQAVRKDFSVNKSSSAASLSEPRQYTDSTRSGSTNSNSLSSIPFDISRRLSSTSNSPTESLRKVTPPSHPSLPARPDWVISQRSKPAIDKPVEEPTTSPS